MTTAFDPKVIFRSRKPHQCYGCLLTIPQGKMYLAHPVKVGKSVVTRHLCITCSFLLSQNPRAELKKGNYTERLIPNALKKVRAEFLKNPEKAIRERYQK